MAISARIVQILDAPGVFKLGHVKSTGSIVRVAVPPSLDVTRLWLKSDEEIVNKAIVVGTWETTNQKVCSFVFKKKPYKLRIFYDHQLVSTYYAKDILHYRIRNDLAMINPAIDPVYTEWRVFNPFPCADVFAAKKPATQPFFSLIIPLYKTKPQFFNELMDSIEAQTYQNFEIILVNASPADELLRNALKERLSEPALKMQDHSDECSQKIRDSIASLGYTEPLKVSCCRTSENDISVKNIILPDNYGITENTNYGIAAAAGDYVCFIDHDDIVDQNLLAAYTHAIQNNPKTDLIYCDEDLFYVTSHKDQTRNAKDKRSEKHQHNNCTDNREGPRERCSENIQKYTFIEPRFKPNYNDGLISSHNYICHCLCVSRYALENTKRSTRKVDGSQDFDMTLRISEVARDIQHVPFILYHWRIHQQSTSCGIEETKPYAIEAGRLALEEHYKRIGIKDCTVVPSAVPCIYETHIMPSEDYSLDIILYRKSCTLRDADKAKNLEILLENLNCRAHYVKWTPNEGKLIKRINSAIKRGDAPYILVMDEAVMLSGAKAVLELVGLASIEKNGIVVPQCLYADGLIARNGIVFSQNGDLHFFNDNFDPGGGGGYLGYSASLLNISAVSGEIFVMRRDVYNKLGALDPCFGDLIVSVVDYCLRAQDCCYSVIVNSFIKATLQLASVFDFANTHIGTEHAVKRLWRKRKRLEKPFDENYNMLHHPALEFNEGYTHFDVTWY